jgi:hypothetical protein
MIRRQNFDTSDRVCDPARLRLSSDSERLKVTQLSENQLASISQLTRINKSTRHRG